MTSHDVVRHLKRNLPRPFGKIGHFGTLDPFASGVLLVGIGGAQRANDLVHELYPKTYLAVGKLGQSTDTGDYTGEVCGVDTADYLYKKIANFDIEFLDQVLRERFLGDYWQSPHKFSAAKFEGKKLYQWAREGIEIAKDRVLRQVHDIKVIRYQFPYLSIQVTVSSGTYVRTLFQEMAEYLGTHGHLISLVRTAVGGAILENAIRKKQWPQKDMSWELISKRALSVAELLKCPTKRLDQESSIHYSRGMALPVELAIPKWNDHLGRGLVWIQAVDGSNIGLGRVIDGQLKVVFNLPLSQS